MAIYVTPFPCPPNLLARNDAGRTNEDTVLLLNVLGNDVGTGLRLQKVGGGTAAIGDVIAQVQTTFGLVQLKLGANNQVVFDPGDIFDSLRLGQSTSFQGTYRVADSSGAVTSAKINITVDGLNDGPSFTVRNGTATFVEAINASAQNLPAVQGSLVVSDKDIGNVLDAKIVGTPTLTYSGGVLPAGNNLSALTSLSALKLTDGVSNGGSRTLSWTYDPTAVNLDFLRPGEILTIRYGVAVSDAHSQATTQNLVFTIRGSNDAPIIESGDPAFDVAGALTETNTALSTTGRVVFTDLDRADTPAATVNTSAAVVTATGITLTAAQVEAFKGGFAITNPGTGAWSYNISAAATQFLGLGDQVKIVYNVVVTDDFGASTTQPVTITIRGTNDGLVLGPTPAQAGFIEAIDASAQNLPAVQRTFLVTDADSGDALTAHIVGTPTLTYSGVTLPPGAILSALINTGALTLGSAVSGGGQRSITATYDPTAVNLDFLRPGETLAINFGIALTDGQTTTPTRFLTVTMTGTNDVPIIQTADPAFDVSQTLNETNSALSTTGRVVFTDLDRADTPAATVNTAAATVTTNGIVLTQAQIDAFKAGFAITNAGTGAWSYNLAAADSQFLDDGEQVQIAYNVVVTDDFGASVTQPVTITINGTNDAFTDANEVVITPEDTPISGSVLTGTVSVDGPVTVTQFTVAGVVGTFTAGQTAAIAGVGTLQINSNGGYTFTPAANFNGVVPVATYTLTDGSSGDTSTLSITVTPVDDAFTDANEAVITPEDTPISGSVLTGTVSVDGPVTVTQFQVAGDPTVYTAGQTAAIAGVGTLQINSNGGYTFTPAANFNGVVPVATYTLTDGSSGDTSTLSITVTPVDDAFTDANEAVITPEDTPISGSVLTGTVSVDGPVTVTQFQVAGDPTVYTAGQTAAIAGVGTLQINSNGGYTFTPAANFNGVVPVATYTLTDGSSGDTSTLSITVTPVDDAFTDANEAVITPEDTPISGSVLTGTVSVDGPVTVTQFQVAGDPTVYTAGQTAAIAGVGTLQINSNGGYTFTPAANFNGVVPVATYTLTDGSSGDTSTLSITVTPVDDAFTDANEAVITPEDTPISGSVLTGTVSVDGPVTVTQFQVAGDPTVYTAGQTAAIAGVGTLQINSNGGYTFTPAANFNGVVPVATYTLTDGSSGDTSTLSITVTPVDDAFTDANEAVITPEDTPISGSVLTGTVSVDGPVTVTQFQVAGDPTVYTAGQTAAIAGVGTLQINSNGGYTFTPAANFNGVVPVATYTLTDGSSGDTSTLSITVTPVDDAFTDANEAVITPEDTPISGSVLTGTVSVDGPVTVTQFQVAGDPTVYTAGQTAAIAGVGTLQINSNGGYTFTPAANFNGVVPVATYTLTDGSSGDTSTLSITVTPVDDAFTDANEAVITPEDTPISGSVLTGTVSVDGPVTVTQFQVAGDPTVYTAGQTAAIAGVGTLQINSNGGYTFTPAANFNGVVPVATYTLTDGSSGDTSTLSITVTPVDDAFTDANEAVITPEDTPISGSVLTGTVSVDGPVTVTQFQVAGDPTVYTAGQTAAIAGVGTLQINSNGGYTFTPAANFNGVVPVATYTLTDGSSGDTSTLSITVTPVDDAFTDANEAVITPEDTPISGSVLTGTVSVDGPVTVTQFQVAGDPTVYTAGQTAAIAGVGTLQINSNGGYTFTPAANFNGVVPVATYTLTDGSSGDTSTLSITVTPVDDAFTDANEAVITPEDTPISGSVLTGTVSVDGPVTVTQFQVAGDPTVYTAGQTAAIAGVGTLQINSNGGYTFTPAANFNGVVPVATYTLTDGSSGDTSTLSITVTPVDDAFTDANEAVITPEDTPISGSVLTGTVSVDGPVTVTQFQVAGDPTVYTAGQTAAIAGVGTLQINSNGGYTFTPAANFNGVVPVATYTLTDGSSGDTSTLSITVTPVDDAFTDANEAVITPEDTPISGSVLTGTVSVDGPVTVTQFQVAGDPTVYTAGQTAAIAGVGTLQINSNGGYTFTPAANFNGVVPVATYTLTDGSSGDTSTLSITVTPVDDATVIDPNKTVWVPSDPAQQTPNYTDGYPLEISAPTDVDGPLTITVTVVPAPGTGQVGYYNGPTFVPLTVGLPLTTAQLTSLVYIPSSDIDDTLSNTFTYSVSDGMAPAVFQTVTINEVPPGRLPGLTQTVADGGSPLTSGNDHTTTAVLTANFATATNVNPSEGTIVLRTDFQTNPIQDTFSANDLANGATFLRDQVEVRLTIQESGGGGTATFAIVMDQNANPALNFLNNAAGSWTADTSGTVDVWTKTIDYDNVKLVSNPTVSLAQYLLLTNPANAGDSWTITYDDDVGGNEQARFAQVQYFFDDPGDPSITVNGAPQSNLIYGTASGDQLTGGASADTIVGRGGNDVITGAGGSDTIRFLSTTDGVDHIADFDAGTNATTVDRLQFDVGVANFSVGDNDTIVDNFRLGNDATINFAGAEIGVKTDASVATANIQSTINSYGAITTGALFAFLDSNKGHAVVYFDPNPGAAGGAVLVAELDNITTLGQLGSVNSTDWNFI